MILIDWQGVDQYSGHAVGWQWVQPWNSTPAAFVYTMSGTVTFSGAATVDSRGSVVYGDPKHLKPSARRKPVHHQYVGSGCLVFSGRAIVAMERVSPAKRIAEAKQKRAMDKAEAVRVAAVRDAAVRKWRADIESEDEDILFLM